jgi:hypothetical protein
MKRKTILYGCAVLSISLIAASAWAVWGHKDLAGVSVIGFHHMGREFSVNEFTIDLGYYGEAGFEGSGTSVVCCVALPRKWRPGMMVDVRWSASDLHDIYDVETSKNDYSRAKFLGYYRANVEVERYERAGDLIVHFFPKNKVRVVSSDMPPQGEGHPIALHDVNAARLATQGYRIEALWSAEELEAMHKQWEEHKRRYGDWR